MMKLPKGADLSTLKSIALKVIDVLESKVTHSGQDGDRLPLLMTRVDMGVMRDGEFKPWVNEVEYVPSYYVEDHTHAIEGTVARQCAVIAKKFLGIDDKLGLDNSRNVDLEKVEIEPILCVSANTNSKATTESTAPLIESRITPVSKATVDQPSVEKDSTPMTHERSSAYGDRFLSSEAATLDDTLTMDSSVVLEVIP